MAVIRDRGKSTPRNCMLLPINKYYRNPPMEGNLCLPSLPWWHHCAILQSPRPNPCAHAWLPVSLLWESPEDWRNQSSRTHWVGHWKSMWRIGCSSPETLWTRNPGSMTPTRSEGKKKGKLCPLSQNWLFLRMNLPYNDTAFTKIVQSDFVYYLLYHS